jgi:pyruvate dehydrogenase E2 component (dihydrolipoamide acetyltransferase)
MSLDVVMPRLSDSMEEGTIIRWLAADGDAVTRGAELVEIETDKATMTYEADDDGLVHHVAREGDTLPVGAVIARLLSPGETPEADGNDAHATATGTGDASDAHGGDRSPSPSSGEPDPAAASTATAAPPAPATSAPASPGTNGHGERLKASPVARRLARERAVDLAGVAGSGPGGRIVKADVLAAGPAPAPAAAPAAPAPAAAPEPAPAQAGAKGAVTVQELTRLQQTVARRMAETKATVPEFTLTTDVDMEAAVALRGELKAAAGEGGTVPSFNDLVVKAAALALRRYPRANGSYRDGRFELYERVNVGIAVAAQDALVVPTIFDADQKSLGQIARDARAVAGKVRDGSITPPELSGGTFAVSNLGMYGVTSFTAIINAPQAAILAVGALAERAVARNGEIVARHTMSMTLSCDHRILYGADAAEFLAEIRTLLESPLRLVL